MSILQKGTILHGTYKIEEKLGQGSFGITYLAEHVNLGKKVAIKEFFMRGINNREEDGSITGMSDDSLSYNYCQKFKKEAINLSRLDHPNIVTVTDSFAENGTYYYVMNYIDGQNLNDYIKSHHISETEAVDIIKTVADSLIYMHEKHHMLHLDLKPGNIMRCNSDGHIYLIDFGLSKHFDKNGQPDTSTSIGLGTPGYAPTEQGNQAKNGEFRPTIDVYALGATFYKLLTGETPPDASTLVSDDELLEHNLREKNVSDNIIQIVVAAMLPNVRKRIQNVRAFKNALESINDENTNTVQQKEDATTISVDGSNEQQKPTYGDNGTEKVGGIKDNSNTDIHSDDTISVGEQNNTTREKKEENIEVPVSTEEDSANKKSYYSIFSFKGRVSRSRLWATIYGGGAIVFLPMVITCWTNPGLLRNNVFFIAYLLCVFLFYYISLTVGAKRCHDLGHSGWFQMIPFYGFMMLLSQGDDKDNEYGSPNNGVSVEAYKKIIGIAAIIYFLLCVIVWNPTNDSGNSGQNPENITTVTDARISVAGYPCYYSGQTYYYNPDTVAVSEDDYSFNIPHGQGEANFDDGRYYKGPFIDGVMSGENAYFSYPNGDVFVGSFANNEFKEGKYTIYKTGEEFVGTFKNGQPSKGTWYDKKGNVLETIR